MITNHTAQSLGKYLGQKVHIQPYGASMLLVGVDILTEQFILKSDAGSKVTRGFSGKDTGILPILKDYTQLLVPMMHEGVEIMPIEWVYGWDEKSKINLKANGIEYEKYENIFEIVFDDFINTVKNDLFVFDRIQKLQALGFGAIKCDESPTGYRDLWNNPCALDEGK